ncbi:cysteine hydrolase family protein [Virgibacillus kimchii]
MNNSNTALLLIDLQKESNFGLKNMDQVIANTKEILQTVREAALPIIYTRQVNREDGMGLSLGEPLNADGTPFFYNTGSEQFDILDEITPNEKDIIIDKYRWSAFHETNLDLLLRNMGIRHLIVGGVVTDGCVLTTVYDAYFRDYHVHLVEDMITATNEGAHMSAILTMVNWIYNLKVYNTPNMINKLKGEKYSCWQTDAADTMQFTPETMREQMKKIYEDIKGESK